MSVFAPPVHRLGRLLMCFTAHSDWLGLCLIPSAAGLPNMVTYDTSRAGTNAGTERGPRGLLCPSSPVKPSHSGPLGTCYIYQVHRITRDPSDTPEQPKHSSEVSNGKLSRAWCTPDMPTLLLPKPAMLAHSVPHRHRDARPLKSCQAP